MSANLQFLSTNFNFEILNAKMKIIKIIPNILWTSAYDRFLLQVKSSPSAEGKNHGSNLLDNIYLRFGNALDKAQDQKEV